MPNSLTEIFGVDRPVALVTGSGKNRVGRHIARRLAQAGYRIVLHAHHSVEEAEQTCKEWNAEGFPTSVVTGAVDDEKSVAAWIDQITQKHGGLHVLVNSAAAWEPTRLEELDEERLAGQWRVNLMGPTLLCRAAGLAMAKQPRGGAIINIGDWAIARPYPDFAAYMLSKGAIRTLTEVMAVELASRNPGIRVNAIFPGPVLLDDNISAADRKKIIEQSLVKREGKPEDVAAAVQFLVENSFITSVCLPVDGGRTIFAGNCDDVIAHPNYQRDK